ncbi:MAG: pyridoxamine 5'-phosphate oxidase family protein [Candidatus Saccharibacteria bacterium]|nr:pyridoxamine 5'-phosphate oxidase family protein [Candidatus Saccharibacteria bacterium]
MDAEKIQRIRDELKAAGTTWYGLKKTESRYLPKLLHETEHIAGVVYGQYPGGSGMLVATDLRIIFIDRKPGYTHVDEITYDMVSGIGKIMSGPFTSVALHTRLGDYRFKYVNAKAAAIFVSYIERRRLEKFKVITDVQPIVASGQSFADSGSFTAEALHFLQEHDLAVFSTVDKSGDVHGAVVYYIVDESGIVYLVTKSQTRKALDILSHSQVALTVYDAGKMQTLQLQGRAKIETDQAKKDKAFNDIIRTRLSTPGGKQPAVMKIQEGSFIIISITPTVVYYRDFGKTQN